LQDDGNCDGTLLDKAGALFGLRIAFDEAVAERAECIFGRSGHTLDFVIHHTPPENFLRAVGFFAAPASEGCDPETSAALAGM
jgi:hypothetical protein